MKAASAVQIADSLSGEYGSPRRVPDTARTSFPTMKSTKSQDSLEALYALIFAVCVLLALFLLVG